jgi:hypothetical protein
MAIVDIHIRIGMELSHQIIRKAIYLLVAQQKLLATGIRASSKYSLDHKQSEINSLFLIKVYK